MTMRWPASTTAASSAAMPGRTSRMVPSSSKMRRALCRRMSSGSALPAAPCAAAGSEPSIAAAPDVKAIAAVCTSLRRDGRAVAPVSPLHSRAISASLCRIGFGRATLSERRYQSNRNHFLSEQREVDRVAHLAVTGVARMQSVAAIVHGAHLGRDVGVAQRGVEIGDPVEHAGLPDPGIDRDPVLLARRIPGIGHVGLIAERCQRRANDFYAGSVRAQRHLLQAGNYLLGGDFLLGLRPPLTQLV